ncbi:MAG: DNA-directed RNA polymerase subunit alpha [Candidatus Cryosericum sp.]|nr:DNA-directed RNA polymerase subunit alpha [bacterium]
MIEGLEGIRLTSVEETSEYGKFVFEPLQHGYGVTMGNALRRVLLSSIHGSAPVAIKVNGALHEFTTLPGIKEDLQEIIFNVRNLQVSILGGSEATLSLKHQGRGIVKAEDFEKNPLVKIRNPDLKIAELSGDDSVLDLQVLLRTGFGYVSNEENHELLGGTVDTIAIDSIFSPVRTVNFTVEPVRIKQKADSERLILEIAHFPTIKARDALEEALEIIGGHVQQLEACLKMQSGPSAASVMKTSDKNVLSMTLEAVDGIKSRWAKVLKAAGIETVADYLEHRGESISDFGEAGRKSVDEALSGIGMNIPED